MRFIAILLTLVLGLCDGARRTTTAVPTADAFEGRQLGPSQRQGLENVWDLVDLQKLDNHANPWNNIHLSTNATEAQGSDVVSTRQGYPGLPNPGDSNELPGPISPPITIRPIPAFIPPPGCLAPRGQFPSKTNCANYLNCWDDVVTEQTCPDGLLFNDVSLVCDYDYNVNCGSRPLPTPKPPLPDGSKLCPEPNGRYRSATNCSEFYVCVYRKPIKFSCPRGLVYNDILGVCDYPYNVDCKGASTPPLPPKITTPLPLPPSLPTQRPTYAPPPPYGPPQPVPLPGPSYGPSPQPGPSYGPSPQPGPSYGPSPQPAYPGNPWLGRVQPDPWHQRPAAAQIEIDKEQQQELFSEQQQGPEEAPNPWNLMQNIPAPLTVVPCKNGDVHRLNDACTNVVVCREQRPQLLQCLPGLTYDKPSDSCQPFSIAKC